jgi:T4 RnlA family RNA ligase
VDFCLDGDIVPIFEYVSFQNRIVLRYPKEELILLRLRDNKTGKHIDIKDHLDKIGSIKIAAFEDGYTLEDLIEKSKSEVDKEGWVVQFENAQMIKIKTDWYRNLHSIYTSDIYREHIIIGYILDDVIDDVVSQIPEDEKETHLRIQKIISIVKKTLKDKVDEIQLRYQEYVESGLSKKDYAFGNKTNSNFRFVMNMDKAQKLKSMSKEEILDIYDDMESYERVLKRCQPYEMAVEWLRDKTKRLEIAREWLEKEDSTLFFKDPEMTDDDN